MIIKNSRGVVAMKKRRILIALAIIALMISGILVINKESYADKDYRGELFLICYK